MRYVTHSILFGCGVGAAQTTPPVRHVLPGLRRVAYHTDRWRFTPFCSALDACLQYLGQEEQYDRLMATSGGGVSHHVGGGPDKPFGVHSDAVDVVAEGRYYASVFLKQAASALPEAADDLLEAARCCRNERDLMWDIWALVGGNQRGPDQRDAFHRPEIRRQIAAIILRARNKDAEAADHIARALERTDPM